MSRWPFLQKCTKLDFAKKTEFFTVVEANYAKIDFAKIYVLLKLLSLRTVYISATQL